MIERPDLQEVDRYQTTEGRADYREEIEKIFQEWFDRHSRAEIFEAGQSEGLPCAPIQTTGDALENEQFKSRDYFVDLAHPEAGVLTYPGLPFLYSDMPRSEPTPAPTLGQHNTEVYGDLLGLNEQDLAEFRERGVI
jgi:crotonobetainyl-CoA:carnitine CoA-transferase CaiB-like acyl-CoA transferase